MGQQILQLRSNELYICKLCNQIDALREAFEFCDTDLASQCFNTSANSANQPQFLQVLQDQVEAIVKASATTATLQDPSSQLGEQSSAANDYVANRKALQERIIALISENGAFRKHRNMITNVISNQ